MTSFAASVPDAARNRNPTRHVGDTLLASTDILLPGGRRLVVLVEGGKSGDSVTIADDGTTLAAIGEAGLELSEKAYRSVRKFAGLHALSLEGGVLRSHPVPPAEIPVAIVTTANALRDVCVFAFDQARKHEQGRFRERVERALATIFQDDQILRRPVFRGASDENLRFDYAIAGPASKRLVLDAPLPEPSSIAAVVLRQADLLASEQPGIAQAILYDDDDHWSSIGLSQLRLARVPLVSALHLREGLMAAGTLLPDLA